MKFTVRASNRLQNPLSIIWLSLIFLAILAATVAQAPITDNDSGSYLGMSAFRSLGYPVFLSTLSAIGFELHHIVWIQALVFAIASSILVRLLSLRISFLVGAGVAIGLLLNPHLTRYQFTILTEGLWVSVLLLWIAALAALFFTSKNQFWSALWLGLLTGLAYAIRPASFAMAPMLLLAPLLLCRDISLLRAVRLAAVAIVAFLAVAGVERGAHRIVHADTSIDQMAFLLFARALMLEEKRPPHETAYPTLTKAVGRDFAPVHKYLREETDIRVRQFLNVRYEALAHFAYRPSEFPSIVANDGGNEMSVLRRFGTDRILGNPSAFITRGLEHFLGMWTIFRVSTPAGAAALQNFLDRNDPLVFANLDAGLKPAVHVRPLAGFLQYSLWAAGAFLSLLMIITGVLFLVRRPMRRETLFNLAIILTLQGSYLAIAAFNTAIERFTIVYLPLIYIALCIAAFQFFRHVTAKTPTSGA